MVIKMQIESAIVSPADIFCDTLILGIFNEIITTDQMADNFGVQLAGLVSSIIRDQPDCSEFGEITIVHNTSVIGAKRIILLGLGRRKILNLDKIRELSAKAIRGAKKLRSKSVATTVFSVEPIGLRNTAQAIIEGAILGSYEFNYYKTDKKENTIEKLIIVGDNLPEKREWDMALEHARILAESVNFARDLVNHPSCFMTPSQMASAAHDIIGQTAIEICVLDKEDMAREKMHALLAVAQGSDVPAKMIVLKYTGDFKSNETIALIGKGITFDSGGISLKPSEKMGDMKGDMAGGAAVLGAMRAIGHIKPKVNIIAVVPCCENMPSGHALKPGDVISSMSGKTIEIISTDAEGRLILADAVSYARKLGATKIVDLATLTGACVVALGNVTSGLISNNDDWSGEVLKASQQTGEKMWRLPSFEDYFEQIKSDIADLKNSGGRMAGTITAGLFVGEFAGSLPWVHIDIAGTSDIDKVKSYNVKGATGVGVRTLVQLMNNLSAYAC